MKPDKLTKVALNGPITMSIPIDEGGHPALREVTILEKDTLMVVDFKGTPRMVLEAVCENLAVRTNKALQREVIALRAESEIKGNVADELQYALNGVPIDDAF